jgi:hypothetical protein
MEGTGNWAKSSHKFKLNNSFLPCTLPPAPLLLLTPESLPGFDYLTVVFTVCKTRLTTSLGILV